MKIKSVSTVVDESVLLGHVAPGTVVRLRNGHKLALVNVRYHAAGLASHRATSHGYTRVTYLGSGGVSEYTDDHRVYVIQGEFVTDSPFSLGE